MERVCAPLSSISKEALRTPSVKKAVRTTLVLVALIVLAGLPVTNGQNLTLQHEPVPDSHDQHNEKSNTSHGQAYEAKYFKCRCEGNQAWNGSGCVDTQTKVLVTKSDTNIPQLSLTDDFAGVTVRNVRCSSDHLQMNLDLESDPSQQFTLLPKGTLLWHEQEYEHYCIEHLLNAQGEPIPSEAHVCLPPPAVPRCCLDTQDGSSSCGENDSAYRFSPYIKIGEKLVEWPEVTAVAGRKCKQNEKEISLPLNSGKSHLSYESGALSLVWETSYHFKITQQEGFCVRREEGGSYVVTICYEDQEAVHRNSCTNVTCVRKCCPEGQIHSAGVNCLPAEDEAQLWKPNFVNTDLTSATPSGNVTMLYGWPHCFLYQADPSQNENDGFYLLENGELFSPASNDRDPPTKYCVDNFVAADTDNMIVMKALICITDVEIDAEPVCTNAKQTMYPVLLLVSTVFLGITLFIYLSVPDLRGRLHGHCLISLTFAFFVAFLLTSISYLTTTQLSSGVCTTIAFFKHLSLLAAFFWLNVMCYDIWRTLRRTRTATAGRRFLWYSLYAWGSALVIALVAAVLQQQPLSSGIITPNFDNMFCWFTDKKRIWIYFYSWVSLVLATNIVFFALVMVILIKGQRNSMLRRSREMNRERMWLYVKLFLVMGVTWIAEVVSYQHGKCAEWMVMDIINALEGVTLFLVFILNRSTLNKIRERWGCGTSGNGPSRNMTITSHFSTSSSFHSRMFGSMMSNRGNSRYASTNSNSKNSNSEATEMRSKSPMNTLSEAPEESTHVESTEHESNIEEGETSRLNKGNQETSAI